MVNTIGLVLFLFLLVTERQVGNKIDWTFLDKYEGKCVTQAYVPTRHGVPIGRSGVTVSTGFDIGQQDKEVLYSMKLPKPLVDKLVPYLGLRGASAIVFLKHNPLKLTEVEAKLIDVAIKLKVSNEVEELYARHAGKDFETLPVPLQTVLASLAFNFGSRLDIVLPTIWRRVVDGRLKDVEHLLRTTPWKQKELQSRRYAEADLLVNMVA